jgi:pyruvate,water dikinase
MTTIRAFQDIHADELALVGGKGNSLAQLTAAGLPVPPGFCVTTVAYRQSAGLGLRSDSPLAQEITDAYRRLGGGRVAVRSSATLEDGMLTSFAGQQETVLGVLGESAVLEAVRRCWESLDSERAVAYRRRQGVDDSDIAMAVVVQQLVDAEIAGVLFTRDPLDPSGRCMLVEAAWGLGETVVSGQATPDRYQVDRETGAVRERSIATKVSRRIATGTEAVPSGQQVQACLDDAMLVELAALGRRVEALYGDARDVEWAYAGGKFWLLQARPITVGGAAEREQVCREERAALAARTEPGGTVWSRFNLAEVLPEPTPMSWAVVRRFLSGQGGYGRMYRDLGFDPDPALDEEGIYDLVCGRPYCNLSREPRMQFRWLPFEHSFAVLKKDPAKALYPRPVLNPSRASWRFWLFLPWWFTKLTMSVTGLRRLSQTFAGQFRAQIIPPFAAACREARQSDLSRLDPPALVEELERWIRLCLEDFARDSLKPTVLAAVAMDNLERNLSRSLGPERARAALGELSLGARPDPEADLPQAIGDLGARRMSREQFLDRFGHRGHQEMELSRPRWAEDPAAVDRLRGQALASDEAGLIPPADTLAALASEAKLNPVQLSALQAELGHLHTYLGLRETAKHYLMMGYAQIRRILIEIDRRFRLGGGIYFLLPDELPRLLAGEDVSAQIAERRRRRQVALNLEVPQVLFSDDLEAIGRPVPVLGAETLQGVPLSAGVAEGPALVLEDPMTELPTEPYVLVCPSTDPAWVPLFVQARALVMETGGVLSHGAIVAREFGLPAVAGLPGVQRRLRTGQRVRVDGASGTVSILSDDPHGLHNPGHAGS